MSKRRRSVNAMLGMRGYDAANPTRRVRRTWLAPMGNSDTDDLPSLSTLRNESGDAYRNQPIVKGAIDTTRYNVLGGGLTLQSQPNHEIIGITAEEAAVWAKHTEFEFSQMWAGDKSCDAERKKTWGDIQVVALYSALLRGDVIAMLPQIDRGNVYSTSVMLIEADRLSNPNGAMDCEKIAGGIESDEYGATVAYHFSKNHPGGLSMTNKWIRVPAYGEKSGRPNVIHLSEYTRPGQRRGVPGLAPVLEALKQLSEYTTAELESAIVSGLFTVFIKTERGELPDPMGDKMRGKYDDDESLSMTPGGVIGLTPGDSVETANPGRPNTAFGGFVEAILKQVGAALQVPFELLMKHFSSSYSASRAALLEAWKSFKTRRTWFANNFCQPIYKEWLYEAVLTGRIIAPGFLESPTIRAAYCQAVWNGPAPGQLDPVKETTAAKMRVEEGFSTRTKESAEINGTDFETNATSAIRENKIMKESGLLSFNGNIEINIGEKK